MVIVISALIPAILLAAGILMVLRLRKKRKEGEPAKPDYRAFFGKGIIWGPAGIVVTVVSFILQIPFYVGLLLLGIGAIYLAIGLANRDKWKNKSSL